MTASAAVMSQPQYRLSPLSDAPWVRDAALSDGVVFECIGPWSSLAMTLLLTELAEAGLLIRHVAVMPVSGSAIDCVHELRAPWVSLRLVFPVLKSRQAQQVQQICAGWFATQVAQERAPLDGPCAL